MPSTRSASPVAAGSGSASQAIKPVSRSIRSVVGSSPGDQHGRSSQFKTSLLKKKSHGERMRRRFRRLSHTARHRQGTRARSPLPLEIVMTSATAGEIADRVDGRLASRACLSTSGFPLPSSPRFPSALPAVEGCPAADPCGGAGAIGVFFFFFVFCVGATLLLEAVSQVLPACPRNASLCSFRTNTLAAI